ncbi:hypothetical protein [Streptomyces afghaniensis]|uniref:hypothetical protein n=1 Tax=Streptomyces afghaniensis TaxID=66865 RepID=UPI0027891BD9|nr:hypothetical protein [Streptomyces afghaniensis]MDQ1016673.1 hypothetical protein [Streptomyces afghaniensis]
MKRTVVGIGSALAALSLSACSSSATAPVEQREKGSAEIYVMPDDFPSVASKCDGHGNRIFVSEDGEKAGFDLSVVADLKCMKKENNR